MVKISTDFYFYWWNTEIHTHSLSLCFSPYFSLFLSLSFSLTLTLMHTHGVFQVMGNKLHPLFFPRQGKINEVDILFSPAVFLGMISSLQHGQNRTNGAPLSCWADQVMLVWRGVQIGTESTNICRENKYQRFPLKSLAEYWPAHEWVKIHEIRERKIWSFFVVESFLVLTVTENNTRYEWTGKTFQRINIGKILRRVKYKVARFN